MGVDEADSAASKAGKGSVDRPLPQHLAVDAVIGSSGDGSDHVGRVNVFDIHTLQSDAQLCDTAACQERTVFMVLRRFSTTLWNIV